MPKQKSQFLHFFFNGAKMGAAGYSAAGEMELTVRSICSWFEKA